MATNTQQPEPLIVLEGVGFRSGKKWLVQDVDLAINRGEICTIIGPNGSGKSTTIKLACGVYKPTHGTVKQSQNLRIGYVPQSVQINNNLPMSVKRFISISSSGRSDESGDLLDSVGLKVNPQQSVQSLSGGEFQRLLIARALGRNPDLLVLDEPVQGVDYTGEIEIYNLIKTIRDARGCGILLVSHDLHIVMAATDTVVCLNGHVCCRGTPQSVVNDPAYRALFGAKAAETLAIYTHQHDHTHGEDGRVHKGCKH